MASLKDGAAELRRHREMLIAQAELERAALRLATQDVQIAGDRIARAAIAAATLLRRYWLPAGLLLAGGLSRRARPLFRIARTGLAVWRTVQLLRAVRR